jgi:methylmalonyl-CoA/ethylmalonyl-CoA epimerase
MKAVLDHIGIAVGDLRAALAFYRDALGLEVEGAEEVESQGVRAHFIPVGSGRSGDRGPRLELLEATRADSPIAKYVAKRGPGLHHITLLVDDIGAAVAHLRARGVRMIDEAPRAGAEGSTIAFVHPSATGGVLIELKAAGDPPAADGEGRAGR